MENKINWDKMLKDMQEQEKKQVPLVGKEKNGKR